MPDKLHLAHKPTPLWHHPRLDEIAGTEVWVKRDDMTGGAEAGNKLRKLEYLVAEALNRGARALITCGAAQSNHARATALTARRFGLECVVFLRTRDAAHEPNTGNLRLIRMCGARIEFVNHAQYADRDQLMQREAERLAAEGNPAYVIPEGGSSGLGCLGYVDAVAEIAEQQRLGLCPDGFDAVVCACGSGGTAAGLVLGAGRFGVAQTVQAIAVCDDAAYFQTTIERVLLEAQRLMPELTARAPLHVVDRHKGPAYGVMSEQQQAFMTRVAQQTGLVLDPTYSGKALYGLSQLGVGRALFIHTGGLPGLLA